MCQCAVFWSVLRIWQPSHNLWLNSCRADKNFPFFLFKKKDKGIAESSSLCRWGGNYSPCTLARWNFWHSSKQLEECRQGRFSGWVLLPEKFFPAVVEFHVDWSAWANSPGGGFGCGAHLAAAGCAKEGRSPYLFWPLVSLDRDKRGPAVARRPPLRNSARPRSSAGKLPDWVLRILARQECHDRAVSWWQRLLALHGNYSDN